MIYFITTILLASSMFLSTQLLAHTGHTDNVGNQQQNMELSQKRAQAVKIYLVEKGIHPSRLTARGFDQTEPAAINDTAEGRAKIRRVELRIH